MDWRLEELVLNSYVKLWLDLARMHIQSFGVFHNPDVVAFFAEHCGIRILSDSSASCWGRRLTL